MQQVLTTNVSPVIKPRLYNLKESFSGVLTKFLLWCDGQQESRLLWMGLAFIGLTIFAIPCLAVPYLLSGVNNFNVWIITCVVNIPILALNLAAQPTRVTIPALFISWAINLIIILSGIVTAIVQAF